MEVVFSNNILAFIFPSSYLFLFDCVSKPHSPIQETTKAVVAVIVDRSLNYPAKRVTRTMLIEEIKRGVVDPQIGMR